MTTTFSEVERVAIARGTVAINIQRHADGWRVHCRHDDSGGFNCAQTAHPTIASALAEHFPELRRRAVDPLDLSDLLA